MYKILANTLFIGQNRVFVPQCHSTNSVLADLIRNTDLPEGTIVITDHQTAGRGQRGNTWEAEPGKNLTFSLLLEPSFLPAKDQFFLTIIVSLALRELLSSVVPMDVKIKWPNDILIDDKKIAGILIENTLSGDKIQQSVIGIGLNVNQTSFSIDSPTSMKKVTGHPFSLEEILNSLLEKLEAQYLHLRSGKFDFLKQTYINHLYWHGQLREFRTNNEVFKGVITYVEENGKLTLLRDNKEVSFDLKEISFVQ